MTTTTSTLTREPSVPAADRSPGALPGDRPRLQLWIAIACLVLLIALAVVAALPTIPYLSIEPGSVRPVTEQVLVEGVP